MSFCEMCGKTADTEGITAAGPYCIDCLKLTKKECSLAIRKLQERAKGKPKSVVYTQEQVDTAFNTLINQPRR